MFGTRKNPPSQAPRRQFESFSAAELYCPRCRRAMPVRENVALYLANETLMHYRCTGCNDVLGKKTAPGSL